MTALPSELPDTARRWVTRVAPDPYLRLDTNDYSLDPRLVGQRVEVRADQREVTAVALDTGELACRHTRVFARHRTITALDHARALRDARRDAGRDGGRGPAAGPLRRADRMSATSELAHLFRALKAPAAARALPKLADRARSEDWSYEQFAAALLKTETDSRDSHGGQGRIKTARFPARKTLEEFDFSFQRSIKKTAVLHLGQLDFLAGKENVVLLGPPGTGKTHLSIALGIRACLAGHRVAFRTATEWVALLADAQRQGRLDAELDKLQRIPLLIVDEVGYIPFDPQAANLMFMLVSRRYERASMIVTSNKPFSGLGRDLRRRRHRRRDDRPARSPRRDPRPQRRLLPPQRPRPRPPHRRLTPARTTLPQPITNQKKGVNFQPAPRGQFSSGLDTERRAVRAKTLPSHRDAPIVGRRLPRLGSSWSRSGAACRSHVLERGAFSATPLSRAAFHTPSRA